MVSAISAGAESRWERGTPSIEMKWESDGFSFDSTSFRIGLAFVSRFLMLADDGP
jgi:hypothetical protein